MGFDASCDSPETLTERFFSAVGRGDAGHACAAFEEGAAILSDQRATVVGREAIGELLSDVIGSRATVDHHVHRIHPAGPGLCVLYTEWSYRGLEPDGEVALNTGVALSVVRRGGDGTWRVAFADVNPGWSPR